MNNCLIHTGEKPLISVIVPVYKVEEYLDRCVESIVNQTYKNLEIILVDDGSLDRSGEMCDEWADMDNRIKVIHQKNAGVSAARNAGLEIATGEWVGFVDSDDYIAPQMYECLILKAIQDNNIGMIGGDFVFMYSQPMTYYLEFCEEKFELPRKTLSDNIFDLFFNRKTPSNVWVRIYKKGLLKNVRFQIGQSYAEDWRFNMDVAMNMQEQGLSMLEIPKSLVFYTINEQGLTSSGKNRNALQDNICMFESAVKFAKRFPTRGNAQRNLSKMWSILLWMGGQFNNDKEFLYKQKDLQKELERYVQNIPWADFLLMKNPPISMCLQFFIQKYLPSIYPFLRRIVG